MRYEISTVDDNGALISLTFDNVNVGLVGESLVLFSEEDEQPVCGFAGGMWTTFRRVNE